MNPRNEEKKRQIYDFINEYVTERGCFPQTAVIAEGVGCAKSTVSKFVSRLREEGLIERVSGARMITRDTPTAYRKMPIVGRVACGKPRLAIEDIQGYLPVPREIIGDDGFGLIAEGESMVEAGISPGDIVYVRRQDTADDGDIVVAMIDDGVGDGESATLKRFYRDQKNKRFILHPENSAMQDITVPSLRIIGVAVRVLKSL